MYIGGGIASVRLDFRERDTWICAGAKGVPVLRLDWN